MNHEEDDAILGITADTHATTSLNETTLPPTPLHLEDVPPPLPPSLQDPTPLEMNEILANLVNLLHQ